MGSCKSKIPLPLPELLFELCPAISTLSPILSNFRNSQIANSGKGKGRGKGILLLQLPSIRLGEDGVYGRWLACQNAGALRAALF
jgi:hypothetical protein